MCGGREGSWHALLKDNKHVASSLLCCGAVDRLGRLQFFFPSVDGVHVATFPRKPMQASARLSVSLCRAWRALRRFLGVGAALSRASLLRQRCS